ncbi:hypothetical protein [Sphaerisporangium siamense]|uniref:Uncharacterized protein n=1 Tax=Sphaerisporangium siamense TaxID=795645 RepID=A0A7W7G938_9ACTN|nr:hypothetical protein [Sphaerisporangium siamense]MBB4700897.1 hypothetical protein [Sphaerisporangium siamense]
MTTVSAVVASLGLTGAVLLATAPLTSPRANAAQAALADPTQVVEPSDPTITDIPEEPQEEPEPTVTVTITESPDPTVTKTRTVTPKPRTTTKSPKPPKPSATKTTPIAPPPTQEPLPTAAPVIPTNQPIVPSPEPTPEASTPDPQVMLELASPTPTPTPDVSEPANMAFEDPTPDSVPIVIRKASPEYDQLTLSRKLAIPGVLLAVLVMLGVLIFEGRLRRMAHAAAVQKAGPRVPGRHRGDFPGAYPMPGQPIYHAGTTYAPIISFVPVHGYPAAPYQDPYAGFYDPATGMPMTPGQTVPPAGPADPWPRADATATFPMTGQTPPVAPQGQVPGEQATTVQGPLPKPKRRGLFRRS